MIAQARVDGIPDAWMEAARKSPVYKMAVEWKVALPLHPEYRTLPMVWYVPPLSPISAAANAGQLGTNGEIPDVKQLRIPVKYLANLLTAGDTAPVVRALERMLAMRAYQRDKHVDGRINLAVLQQVGLSEAEVEEMYHVMAIANYEDRFVIPTHAPRVRREHLQRARRLRLQLRQRLLRRRQRDQPVRQREEAHHPHQGGGLSMKTPEDHVARRCACWRALLSYPDAALRAHLAEMRQALRRRSARCSPAGWPNSTR